MTVAELIAQLKKLPQDAEFVVWYDEREVYVGVDKPDVIELGRNEHDELIDAFSDVEPDGQKYVTVGLQV